MTRSATPRDEFLAGLPAVDAAVDRAVGLGATLVRVAEERGERWAVMQDPEGTPPNPPPAQAI